MTAPDSKLVERVKTAVISTAAGRDLRDCLTEVAQAAIAACQLVELAAALRVFDEAMRNGSIGSEAEKHKHRALKEAHRKARALLAKLGD